jgi:hypothetical protein
MFAWRNIGVRGLARARFLMGESHENAKGFLLNATPGRRLLGVPFSMRLLGEEPFEGM